MSKKLAGKVAIVTGGSKGLGASIALHLAKEGAAVAVNYGKSKEGAQHVVDAIIRDGGKAFAIQASLSNPEDIKRLFSETKKKWGKIDILVNNAGIYEFAPLEDVTPDYFHNTFDLNVLGLLLACKESAQYFGPSGGSIINLSSIASTAAVPNTSVYSASKAAVSAITRCLGAELGPRKIRVNAVCPGMVETEGLHSTGIADSDLRKQVEEQTPLGRIGKPEDVAPAVVFLASDDASWITGESLFISGGFR